MITLLCWSSYLPSIIWLSPAFQCLCTKGSPHRESLSHRLCLRQRYRLRGVHLVWTSCFGTLDEQNNSFVDFAGTVLPFQLSAGYCGAGLIPRSVSLQGRTKNGCLVLLHRAHELTVNRQAYCTSNGIRRAGRVHADGYYIRMQVGPDPHTCSYSNAISKDMPLGHPDLAHMTCIIPDSVSRRTSRTQEERGRAPTPLPCATTVPAAPACPPYPYRKPEGVRRPRPAPSPGGPPGGIPRRPFRRRKRP